MTKVRNTAVDRTVNDSRTIDADVIVVGAGVSGLTTAVHLATSGVRVEVISSLPPERTMSVTAGAIWGPYMARHEDALAWSWASLDRLRALSERPESGITMVRGVEAARTDVDPPLWSSHLPDFAMCSRAGLPAGWRTGWSFTAPTVDVRRYLTFLVSELRRYGGRLTIGAVSSLAALASGDAQVVNCSGLGARVLAQDDRMESVRGELVVVENPGLHSFFLEYEEDPPDLTYFLPQGSTVILGGTAEQGREDLIPEAGTAEAILNRCADIEPRLAGARILERRVGLRPTMPKVRVERDAAGIVHNYGHGGSGLTLSWGCASSVLALLEPVRPAPSQQPVGEVRDCDRVVGAQ